MWARTMEFSIACWLAMSLLIFPLPLESSTRLTEETLVVCILIIGCSLFSISKRMPYLHFLNILWALLLVGETLLQTPSPPMGFYQSRMITGILLLVLAIIPVDCNVPPSSWRNFFSKR